MSRRFLTCSLYWLLALAFVLVSARGARAASNDEEVEVLVTSVLETEYSNAQYEEAISKLELAREACDGKTCSAKTRAKIYMALGTVLASGMKKPVQAKDAFVTALREDPAIGLFGDYTSPEAQRAFNDARAVAKGSGGNEETEEGSKGRKMKKYRGGGRPPAGWELAEAYFYYREAILSQRDREWLDCAYYAQASLSIETRPATVFVAATCEERAGLWIEAYGDYQTLAQAGKRAPVPQNLANAARKRMRSLRARIPKIVIRKPSNAEDLIVKLNDDEVPPKKLGGEIWVNPGQRTVSATGKVDGKALEFEQLVDVAEFETATVEIKLVPKGSTGESDVMRCIAESVTREQMAKCIGAIPGGAGGGGGEEGSLNKGVTLEVSGYHDSDHVNVITPAFSISIENPTAGWGINGSFLVDALTSASTDIVATASPPIQEVRYGFALGGHKKLGKFDVSLGTAESIEPDYLATGGSASISVDLAEKTVTPSLGFDFGYDKSGRSGTSYDTYGYILTRYGINPGLGIVLNKSTFLSLSGTAVFEFGDSSKPYRYVPMFDPTFVESVPVGYSIEDTDRNRLPVRVHEQLPVKRQRWAVAGRIAHRFASSTLRLEERLYIDSWGLKASTTDSTFYFDLSKKMRIWPHLRFHAQSAVDFWKRAYSATYEDSDGVYVLTIPKYRTGDRELGPEIVGTVGVGARYAFGSSNTMAIQIEGTYVYTRYLDHIFVTQRFAYFANTVFQMEF